MIYCAGSYIAPRDETQRGRVAAIPSGAHRAARADVRRGRRAHVEAKQGLVGQPEVELLDRCRRLHQFSPRLRLRILNAWGGDHLPRCCYICCGGRAACCACASVRLCGAMCGAVARGVLIIRTHELICDLLDFGTRRKLRKGICKSRRTNKAWNKGAISMRLAGHPHGRPARHSAGTACVHGPRTGWALGRENARVINSENHILFVFHNIL
jgi:hypothetical protein